VKIIMILLAFLGLLILYIGISTYVQGINNPNHIGIIPGMLFGGAFIVLGGIVLAFDLILLIIFLIRKRRKTKLA